MAIYRPLLPWLARLSLFVGVNVLHVSEFAYASNELRIANSSITPQILQPTITDLFRDSKGQLWIGTQQGLYRYDGHSTSQFHSSKTGNFWIPEDDIRGIAESAEGQLFIATFGGGVLVWDEHLRRFKINYKLGKANVSHTHGLFTSSSGDFWTSTRGELLRYRPDTTQSFSYSLESNGSNNEFARARAFAESSTGDIYIGSRLGLAKWSQHDKFISPVNIEGWESPTPFTITALQPLSAKTIAVGTNSGEVFVLDLESSSVVSSAKIGQTSALLVSGIELFNDTLVVATDNGLYKSTLDLKTIDDISNTGTGLSSTDVHVLYKDGRLLLVGTYNGLDILTLTPFTKYNRSNGGIPNDIMAFTEDHLQRVWVGSYAGLYMLDMRSKSHEKFGLPGDNRISAMDSRGTSLWVGSMGGGVSELTLDSAGKPSSIKRFLSGTSVIDILLSEFTNDAWIASYDHGLIRVTNNASDRYLEQGRLPERQVTLLFESDEGELLAVAVNKLYRLKEKEDRFEEINLEYESLGTSPAVYSINQDENGTIWIGTRNHGLFRMESADISKRSVTVSQVDPTSPLASSTVYGIQFDGNGNLWCSTQYGLLRISPAGVFKNRFTTTDGIQGNDFNYGASFLDSQGYMYFGGANGYNQFMPSTVRIGSRAPRTAITRIYLPTNDIKDTITSDIDATLELPHRHNNLTITFSLVDQLESYSYPFRYKLEGMDSKWTYSGTQNTATYTQLPPGEYTFRAQGSNSAGIWDTEGASLDILVLPPPWLTWWAYTIYAGLLALLFWNGHRVYRSYAIDRKAKDLLNEMFEIERLAEDSIQEQFEHQDDLLETAYNHKLETLSLVSAFAPRRVDEQEDTDNAAEVLVGLKKRMRALTFLEDFIYYRPADPCANLKQYVDHLVAEFLKYAPIDPDTIVIVNTLPDKVISTRVAAPMAVAVYELLENCVLHAFDGASPANFITVSLEDETDEDSPVIIYRLIVTDNGIGVPQGILELAEPESGLAAVQAIAEHLQGGVEIVAGEGTTVTVSIPDPGEGNFYSRQLATYS